MPIDYGRLTTTLSNSRLQVENNALHQTIKGLIDGVKSNQELSDAAIEEINNLLQGITSVNVIEVDTRSIPSTYDLSGIRGMAIIKDVYGNASVNNITLIGTVEGIVDPVINTDYGIYKVYVGILDGLFHTW